MITSGLFYTIFAFLWALTLPMRLLNDVVLPDGISNAIETINGYLGGLNVVLPIDTLLQVLFAILAVEVLILAFKGLNWLIRKIPGVN
jgi:hypothetical protein